MLLCQRDADLYCMKQGSCHHTASQSDCQTGSRMCGKESDTEDADQTADEGGCNEYSANGQANCFNSSAPFVL